MPPRKKSAKQDKSLKPQDERSARAARRDALKVVTPTPSPKKVIRKTSPPPPQAKVKKAQDEKKLAEEEKHVACEEEKEDVVDKVEKNVEMADGVEAKQVVEQDVAEEKGDQMDIPLTPKSPSDFEAEDEAEDEEEENEGGQQANGEEHEEEAQEDRDRAKDEDDEAEEGGAEEEEASPAEQAPKNKAAASVTAAVTTRMDLAPPPVLTKPVSNKGKEPLAAGHVVKSKPKTNNVFSDDDYSSSSVDDDDEDDEDSDDDDTENLLNGGVHFVQRHNTPRDEDQIVNSPQSAFMKSMLQNGKAQQMSDGTIISKEHHDFLQRVTQRGAAAAAAAAAQKKKKQQQDEEEQEQEEDEEQDEESVQEEEADTQKKKRKKPEAVTTGAKKERRRRERKERKPREKKPRVAVKAAERKPRQDGSDRRQPLLDNVDLSQGTMLAMLKLAINSYFDAVTKTFSKSEEDEEADEDDKPVLPSHTQLRNFQRIVKTHSAAEASRLIVTLFGEEMVSTILEEIQKTLKDDEKRNLAAEKATEHVMTVLNHQGSAIASGTSNTHASESCEMFNNAITTHIEEIYEAFAESKEKGNEKYARVVSHDLGDTFSHTFTVARRVGKGKEATIETKAFDHGTSLSEVAHFAYAQGSASRHLPSTFCALGAVWTVAEQLVAKFAEEAEWEHSKPPKGSSRKKHREEEKAAKGEDEAEEEEAAEGDEGWGEAKADEGDAEMQDAPQPPAAAVVACA